MQQALLGRSFLALTLTSRPLQDQDLGFQERRLQSQLAGLIGIYPQRVISHFQGARVSFPMANMQQKKKKVCLQDGLGSLLGTEFPGFKEAEKESIT